MTIDFFPGNMRVGVLHEPVSGVQEPWPQPINPKQVLLVLLDGHQRFRVDDREFLLSTAESPGPKALLLQVERPAVLEYLENCGAPLSKVSVFTDPDWLDGVAASGTRQTKAPLSGHLSHRFWRPSAAMTAIASDLVAGATARTKGSARSSLLFRMSRAIELYRLALSELSEDWRRAETEAASEKPKLAEIRNYIAAHLTEPDLAPDQIARSCGIGLRSLQRLCRETLGCGPGDYIRNQRFEAATTALRQGRATIAQAAHIAGYSSAANFSTAFKREYGIAPRFVRGS